MHSGVQQAVTTQQPVPPIMNNQADDAPVEMTEGATIQTRFGDVQLSFEKALQFEKGLLGIGNSSRFMLADMPSEKLQQFKLLQSLDDAKLSFITLPIDVDNEIIERADLEKACGDIGIPIEELAILLIVSVHRSPTSVKLSVNARAPLLMNAQTREGIQFVFQHSRYQVQQMLAA